MKLETRNPKLETAKAYSRIAFGTMVILLDMKVVATDSKRLATQWVRVGKD